MFALGAGPKGQKSMTRPISSQPPLARAGLNDPRSSAAKGPGAGKPVLNDRRSTR